MVAADPCKVFSPDLERITRENRRDIISVLLAVPWQLALFLMWMMLILRQWETFRGLLLVLAVLSVGLYFLWYRHLGDEVKTEEVNLKYHAGTNM